ncbi:MAG: Transcriptional regulator, ArsR family, partial [uncultured Blastococcus sp.]
PASGGPGRPLPGSARRGPDRAGRRAGTRNGDRAERL